MSDTAYEAILAELETLVEPLERAADDEQARKELFRLLGKESPENDQLLTALTDFTDALDGLLEAEEEPPETLAEFADFLLDVGKLVESIQAIDDALPDADFENFAAALIDHLALRYVQKERPVVAYLGFLLTVIRYDAPSDGGTSSYQRGTAAFTAGSATDASLDLERIPELLSDPSTLVDAYAPSKITDREGVERVQMLVLPWIAMLFSAIGFRPQVSLPVEPTEAKKAKVGNRFIDVVNDENLTPGSNSLTVSREIGGTQVGASLMFGASPDGLQLVVVPFGTLSLSHQSDEWETELEADAEVDAFAVNADGLTFGEGDSPVDTVSADASVRKRKAEGEPAFRLGPANGTRLDVGTFGVEGKAEVRDAAVDADVRAVASDSSFVFDAGEGDGFLQAVLPDELAADFDLGVGWSTERNVYLVGSAGLEADLSMHVSLGGVLSIDGLSLAARPKGKTVPVHVATTAGVTLGPVDAVVEEVGMEAELTFPQDNDGNLGALNVDLSFKPPKGAGLSVDASAVVGGGYLEFDPDNDRYAGRLQLQIGSLTLDAIGLLTTKLPGGRDGFSLLVIITGEFPPVQLGFGFTLNAVGGLLGVNRAMQVEVLRSGLRDGTTKSVLFPSDPMRNPPQLISDLRRIFPPSGGQHVFGPMARLGWGTPTILTADIGVLFELPDPVRLVVLGRLHAALPDDDTALVVFNMDAIGVINFDESKASIDATLYDSRVVAYTLTGDMAMRTNWGTDPNFALSVGGFNPRFTPPENFPSLRRVSLSLGSDNPRLRLAGYFALTSNTVQVGASVDLYAAAAGFSIEGHLGFDALFQFNPFKFIIDLAAGIAIKRGGTTLLSVSLKGTLSGPTPWHIKGKASFKIWPIKFSVGVDKKFGPSPDPEPLPPADVMSELTSALADTRNWSAQSPTGGRSVVTLREVEPSGNEVLAHPLGTLAVRQRIVPLGVPIEKFGNARPANFTRFAITAVETEDTPLSAGDAVREKFAPAQYFERSDDENLSGPAFQQYEAGHRIDNEAVGYGGESDDSLTASATLEYETDYYDEKETPFGASLGQIAMNASMAESFAAVSAVAKSPLRTTGAARFAADHSAVGLDASVSVEDVRYSVARKRDLARLKLSVDGEPTADWPTRREAEAALDAHVAANPDERGKLRVLARHETEGEVTP